MQFLCTKPSNVATVLPIAPGKPLLGRAGAHEPCGKANSSPLEDDAPIAAHGDKLDFALWPPPKQQDHTKAQVRQTHERPTEGVTTSVKPNENAIAVIEGRSTKVHKFGGKDGARGSPPLCPQRAIDRKDNGNDNDVDDWNARSGAKKLRNLIKEIARPPANKNLTLTKPVLESPGEWSKGNQT